MANTIPLLDWLEVMESEYLSSFIPEGGASVKFAVTPDQLKVGLHEAVKERCGKLGMVFVSIDAASRRAHMPQDLFHGLASSVNWREAARRMILKLARERVYVVDGIDPQADINVFEAIAEINGLEHQFVMNSLRPQIQERVYSEPLMARDFRVAMTHLCLTEDTRKGDPYGGQPIIDWLTGSNTRISSVRPFSIYTPINRTTARHFFESALFWLHHAGSSGTVILLDNSRVTLARNPKDGSRYYTRAMVLEHYELLREFVDTTDRLTATMLVVVTSNDFLEEEAGSRNRGFGIYQALMTRVIDDVRDRNLVNPVASLVRISPGEAPHND
jgi:hypothetical protein